MRRTGGQATVEISVEPAGEEKDFLTALDQYTTEDDGEVILVFECDVTPYDPGRTHGPPERCYPPEGGDVEILRTYVLKHPKEEIELPNDWGVQLEDHFRDQIEEQAAEQVQDAAEAA